MNKLVMILLVRDEIDIVEDNLRFHFEQGIDEAVVIDNGSVDGTRELLSDLACELPVQIFDEAGRDHSQGRWVTAMAKYAREELAADWILPNDADEFWLPREGSLKDTILRQKGTDEHINVLNCPRKQMMFGHGSDESAQWHQRLIYTSAKKINQEPRTDLIKSPRRYPHFYYDLPGKVLIGSSGLLEITQGNHTAIHDPPSNCTDGAIDIYHFPVRSIAQFEEKTIQGGKAYALNAHLPATSGWHQMRWYWLLENRGIQAAIDDALPSIERLEKDVASGLLTQDGTIANWFLNRAIRN